jgi:hypothetical protein
VKLQRLWFVLVAVALSSLSLPMIPSALAQNTISDAIPGSRVQIALGAYDVYDPTTAGEGEIEWRGTFAFLAFSPLAGVLATSDGAVYGFAGLYLNFEFFERFVVTPSGAVGLHAKGGGRDLGHTILFRTQIEAAYKLANARRIGLLLSHLSNGGLARVNGGSGSILATYSLPLSSLRPR